MVTVAVHLKVREHVSMVSDEERVGHVGQLLGVLIGHVHGGGLLVRDDVVHEGGSAGARVAQPHGLVDRRRTRETEVDNKTAILWLYHSRTAQSTPAVGFTVFMIVCGDRTITSCAIFSISCAIVFF